MKTEIILEITRCPSGESQWFIKKVPIEIMVPMGINLVVDNIHMHVFDVTVHIPEADQMLSAHTNCDDDNYEEIVECMLHQGWVIHEVVPYPTWEDIEKEDE